MTTPWWHWVIAILAVMYSAGGAYDFIMTMSGDEAYAAAYGEDLMGWIAAFPLWRTILWFVAVFGAAAGAILLVLRDRRAAPVYLIALICMLFGFFVHDLAMSNGAEVYGQSGLIATAVLIAINIGLWVYSGFAAKRKILT